VIKTNKSVYHFNDLSHFIHICGVNERGGEQTRPFVASGHLSRGGHS
jgi:hypothetical protein